jgi:hypothetical protein
VKHVVRSFPRHEALALVEACLAAPGPEEAAALVDEASRRHLG